MGTFTDNTSAKSYDFALCCNEENEVQQEFEPDYIGENQIQTFNSISHEDDILQMYLKDIGKIKLLKAKDEKYLGKLIKEGNKTNSQIAKRKLVQSNLRLVVSIAKKYIGQGVLFMDLVQEGSIGLIKAAERFDYSRNFKFSTYATWWIKQAIIRAISNHSRSIRIPVHMFDKIRKYKKIKRELTFKLEREATDEEIAKAMDITEKMLYTIKKSIMKTPISLETPVTDDLKVEDYIQDKDSKSPENNTQSNLLKTSIEELIATLPKRENQIITHRFGINGETPKTLEELGQIMGYSKERIRQLECEAIKELKNKDNLKNLKDYLL
ncbi:MAG: sigma-70 family RNA polymerase sigma factor [Clostridiaceae bacterium]|jgi:RNA polymerase primary sigma factor|nr:sigma-70 family RNA polymerase sigma factor [Clostridiaceae bacterium]